MTGSDSHSVVLAETRRAGGPILVVEDEEQYARILRKRLEMNDFEVIVARDGEEGLRLARQKHPDVIITDWMMPRMDGLTMIKEIRSAPDLSGTYVIMVSHKSDTDEKVKGFEHGADDYLPKTCETEELVARIRAGQRIRALQEALRDQARRDPLTGLHNRAYFFERLGEEIKRCRRYEQSLTLTMLDLDRFKEINDEHGHLAGDAALCYVADLLRTSCRETDIVARYGGDEFVVLFISADEVHAKEVMERVSARLRDEPFEYNGARLGFGLSYGIVQLEDPRGTGPDDLIQHADALLYEMKRARHAADL